MSSPKKELQIKRAITYFLEMLRRDFKSGIFDENVMENVDRTYFVVNLNNSWTLRFKCDTSVKYTEVVFGGDSMTIVMKIFGGHQSMIEVNLLIFMNLGSNYPI